MLRRDFIQYVVSGLIAMASGARRARAGVSRYAFRHGVASGDPLQDGVIIWTRISGAGGEVVTVRWQVATDPAMHSVDELLAARALGGLLMLLPVYAAGAMGAGQRRFRG